MTEQATPRWIVIPNWDGADGFQHYSDRDPIWIKNYRTLMAKDEYLSLTFHQRGVLHGLWLEYAASNRQLRDSTLTLTRRLGQRVATRDLEALNHAGFIHFSASNPLAPRYQPASTRARRESREEKDLKAQDQKPMQMHTPSYDPPSPNGHHAEEPGPDDPQPTTQPQRAIAEEP